MQWVSNWVKDNQIHNGASSINNTFNLVLFFLSGSEFSTIKKGPDPKQGVHLLEDNMFSYKNRASSLSIYNQIYSNYGYTIQKVYQ